MRWFPLVAVLSILNAGMPHSAAAQPVLVAAQPQAIELGKTTEVVLQGDKLEGPLAVWASFPGQIEIVPELDEAGQPKANPDLKALRLRVTPAPDTPASWGGIVVGNKAGVSELVPVMLDDLPSTTEAGDNHRRTGAQEIVPFTAVEGASDGAAFDYYRFAAKAGQRVAVEVVATRLGSSFDPVLRLLDENGKELAFADDDPALGADCRFAFVAPHDGPYTLELRDVQYRGGGKYRLRVGDFPIVQTTYPFGAPRGATTEFRFVGPDAAATAPVAVAIPANAGQQMSVAAKLAGGQSSASTTVAVSDLPNVLEVEPNDVSEAPQEMTLPAAANGQIQSPGDRDRFRFLAKKDEKWIVRGLSRTCGSPAYLLLRVFDEKGAVLAEAGGGNDVETLTFAAPADGAYQLAVEELLHAGGPGYAYRVEIEPDRPRFALGLKNDKNLPHHFLASPAGAFALELQVERQGYEGPIRLSLEPLREGFQLRQDVIPAGAKEAKLIVLTPADLNEGELLALRVNGAAVEGDARAAVSSAALLKTKRPELLSIPAWWDGLVFAAVVPPLEPFFALTLKEETVAFDKTKNEAKFTLPLERKNKDYKQDPLVFVEGLPAGVSAAIKKEGKDADEHFEIALTGAELPAGEHAFQILAFGDRGARGMKTVLTAKLKVE